MSEAKCDCCGKIIWNNKITIEDGKPVFLTPGDNKIEMKPAPNTVGFIFPLTKALLVLGFFSLIGSALLSFFKGRTVGILDIDVFVLWFQTTAVVAWIDLAISIHAQERNKK